MKKIVIKLIKLYQAIPFSSHGHCKFYPSCSNYAIDAYQNFNFFKATFLTIKRIIRCNPWNKGGYDPIVKEKI